MAPYLERCLDSVAAQTWENLEVWLVDDGSTDGSLALCEARAEQDSRFRVLRQANAGVSAARNRGMDHAAGQYLQFVDGDDFLPPDATENLVRTAAATGADLVVGRFWRVAGGRAAVRGHIREARVLTRQDYAEEMLKARPTSTTACCGTSSTPLYCGGRAPALRHRRQLVRGLPVQPGVPAPGPPHRRLRRPVYCYVKRPGSLVATQATPARTVEMKRTVFAAYKQLYQALDLYEEKKLQVYGYLISAARDGGSVSLRRPRRRRQRKLKESFMSRSQSVHQRLQKEE